MEFFVPGANKPEDADYLYRTWAKAIDAVDEPRIYRIKMTYPDPKNPRIYQVGESLPGRVDIIILALFEVGPGSYVVFAPGYGPSVTNDAGPIAVIGSVAAIEYFEAPG